MQNLSNNEKVIIATRMLYFLLNASQTTDKNLPLCEATDYIKNICELLCSVIKENITKDMI